MGFLKFLVWTGCAVGLGVFLATARVEGRTPWDQAQRQWDRHVRTTGVEREVERVTDDVRDALEDAKEAVKSKTKQAAAPAPRERITNEDRAEINRIIAQKK